MPQAKITKGTDLLEKLMMGISEHEAAGHILQPNPLQVARVIVDMDVA